MGGDWRDGSVVAPSDDQIHSPAPIKGASQLPVTPVQAPWVPELTIKSHKLTRHIHINKNLRKGCIVINERGVLLWAEESSLVSFPGPWSQRSKGKYVACAILGGRQVLFLLDLVCLGGQAVAC